MRKKYIHLSIGIVLSILVGVFLYVFIVSVAMQKLPTHEISIGLIQFKKSVEKNCKVEIVFFEIPKSDLNNCNAKLNVILRVSEDSITQSKELLDAYINSVNKGVNKQLVDKKCIDSLIIDVSSYYSQEKVDSLKSKQYRYSFPIN